MKDALNWNELTQEEKERVADTSCPHQIGLNDHPPTDGDCTKCWDKAVKEDDAKNG